MRICASCGRDLNVLRATGYSGIYNPGDHEIELCEPCFFAEDAMIEEAGTNDLPDELTRYRRVLAAV